MNRYKLKQAGVNANEGIKRLGGNAELYETIINKFPKDTHFFQMLDAIEEKDVKKAFQMAHAVKGMAGNMSMVNLHNTLFPLVEELRAGSMEHVDELIPPVKEAYDMVVKAITG